MIGPLARIVLRYVAAIMVAYGYLTPEAGAQVSLDPDLAVIIGALLGLAVEGCYALAHRWGWST